MPPIRNVLAALALAAVGSSMAVPNLTPTEVNEVKRFIGNAPFAGLPGCDTKDLDPTWATGKSAYKDGDGYWLGNACDNGGSGKGQDHCWTDYFLVGTTSLMEPWVEVMGDIQCAEEGKGSCGKTQAQTNQTCTSFEWSVSPSIGTAFTTALDILKLDVKIDLSATFGTTKQSCQSTALTDSCTWNDGGCHSVWGSDRITHVHGYTRRTCSGPTRDPAANMPNSLQRPDGYYTRGMKDFEVRLPGVGTIDCNGTCDPFYNPGPTPRVDGDLILWGQPMPA